MARSTASVSRQPLTDKATADSGSTIIAPDMEPTVGQVEAATQERSSTGTIMAGGSTHGTTVKSMKENTKMMKKTDLER